MNIQMRAAALTIVASLLGDAAWAEEETNETNEPRDTAPAETAAPFWPSRFEVGDAAFTVYPPQLGRWENGRLEGRAAVAVEAASGEAPVFGVVSLSARADVDRASGMVTVREIQARSADFPAAAERAGAYLDAVQRHFATLTWRVAQARLEADLAIGQATAGGHREPLRNDPPRIVYAQTRTILVPIDGAPVLQEIPGSQLLRVVNTRALILYDRTAHRFFLYLAGFWLEAPEIDGPWTEAQVRPIALDEAKQKALAEGSVDLLDGEEPPATRAPAVVVSSEPAELVQTEGPPQYAPIGRTGLLFVTNSPNRLFFDLHTQAHYVLLAGRWYRTLSLARGPWDYVSGAELPADFAAIPDDHLTASVRAAVPGTTEARESVIANSVPEIATVKRSAARVEIAYDGAPEFRPIPGTVLQAAANAPVPVIRVDAHTYYALDDGVWFFSESAEGPWTAAVFVAPAIYTIPRSHPLHYVTYVRIYDATDEELYVGYTPGYVGSYVANDLTVVYGSGWYYRPWIGTVWYPPPVTWGFGFSVWYSWWDPWPRRAWWPAWRPVPCFGPAWGAWPHRHAGVKHAGKPHGAAFRGTAWPTHSRDWGAADGRGHGRGAFGGHTAGTGDIYRRWDSRSVWSHRAGGGAGDRSNVRRWNEPGVGALPRQRDDARARFGQDRPLNGTQRPGPNPAMQAPGNDRRQQSWRDRQPGDRPGNWSSARGNDRGPQGVPNHRPGDWQQRNPDQRPDAGRWQRRGPDQGLGSERWQRSRDRAWSDGHGQRPAGQIDGGERRLGAGKPGSDRQFERHRRTQHDSRRWTRHDGVAAPAAQAPAAGAPSFQRPARPGAMERPSGGRPDGMRMPRQQNRSPAVQGGTRGFRSGASR